MGKRITNRSVRQMQLRTVCDGRGRFRDAQASKHPRLRDKNRKDTKEK